MGRLWSPHPLQITIVETLQHKGALTDEDLLKAVKEKYGELSYRELNSALLKMEINGIVWVTRLSKGKRHVELAQPRQPR